MEVEILHRPAAAVAHVKLTSGESVTAEAGAMIAMSPGFSVETTTHSRGKGGILSAAKRMLAGESFFLNHYTATNSGGDLYLGSVLPGDMMIRDLDGLGLVVQAGSFVAKEAGVNLEMSWQGAKTLLSGENLFWLRLSGKGKVVLNSYGAIFPLEVNGEVVVDTGHIVAFTESLDFSISKAGQSWIHSFLGGEGLVCRFRGTGTVWCQSHNFTALGQGIGPKLKPV